MKHTNIIQHVNLRPLNQYIKFLSIILNCCYIINNQLFMHIYIKIYSINIVYYWG